MSGSDFSYVPTTPIGRVRMLCGDTNAAAPLLTNAEISAILLDQPIPTYAAAAACDVIANKLSIEADYRAGRTAVDASKKAEAYRKAADRLRRGGAGSLPGGADGTGVPNAQILVGGVTRSEVARLNDDSGNPIAPTFRQGMHDNPPGTPRNGDDGICE